MIDTSVFLEVRMYGVLQVTVARCCDRWLLVLFQMIHKLGATLELTTEERLAKVPQVTLIFWIIKIAATTLGETGGDAVSMSMNLGYLVATAIFAAIFVAAVIAQIAAKRFYPVPYTGARLLPRPPWEPRWPISPTEI